MLNVKNLFVGFVCSVVLIGCQGNSTSVDPEENIEQGVTAADYFEYSLRGEVVDIVIRDTDSTLMGFISNIESDSESLVLTMINPLDGMEDVYDYHIKSLTNETIEIANIIKGLLVRDGYSQDVYINLVDNSGNTISSVSNDSRFIDLTDAYNEMINDQAQKELEQIEQEEAEEKALEDSDPTEFAHNILNKYFPNYNQDGLIESEYNGESVYIALVNTYVDDESIDWQNLRENLFKTNLDRNLIIAFNDADLIYDVNMKELIQTR